MKPGRAAHRDIRCRIHSTSLVRRIRSGSVSSTHCILQLSDPLQAVRVLRLLSIRRPSIKDLASLRLIVGLRRGVQHLRKRLRDTEFGVNLPERCTADPTREPALVRHTHLNVRSDTCTVCRPTDIREPPRSAPCVTRPYTTPENLPPAAEIFFGVTDKEIDGNLHPSGLRSRRWFLRLRRQSRWTRAPAPSAAIPSAHNRQPLRPLKNPTPTRRLREPVTRPSALDPYPVGTCRKQAAGTSSHAPRHRFASIDRSSAGTSPNRSVDIHRWRPGSSTRRDTVSCSHSCGYGI